MAVMREPSATELRCSALYQSRASSAFSKSGRPSLWYTCNPKMQWMPRLVYHACYHPICPLQSPFSLLGVFVRVNRLFPAHVLSDRACFHQQTAKIMEAVQGLPIPETICVYNSARLKTIMDVPAPVGGNSTIKTTEYIYRQSVARSLLVARGAHLRPNMRNLHDVS